METDQIVAFAILGGIIGFMIVSIYMMIESGKAREWVPWTYRGLRIWRWRETLSCVPPANIRLGDVIEGDEEIAETKLLAKGVSHDECLVYIHQWAGQIRLGSFYHWRSFPDMSPWRGVLTLKRDEKVLEFTVRYCWSQLVVYFLWIIIAGAFYGIVGSWETMASLPLVLLLFFLVTFMLFKLRAIENFLALARFNVENPDLKNVETEENSE